MMIIKAQYMLARYSIKARFEDKLLILAWATEMACSRSLLFFILPIILNLLAPSTSQDDATCTDGADFCWKGSNIDFYTNGSPYQENLNTLLYSFSSDTKINYGFYNSSLGQNTNNVNAIALCRGDLEMEACHTCLNASIGLLFQNCPKQKEAIIWAYHCMVRYSHNSIFGIKKEDPIQSLASKNRVSNAEQFQLVLNPLLGILSDKAAAGDSLKKYAAGHAIVPGGETIYALLQCTPDIEKQNCSTCLKNAISEVPGCCSGMIGGRVLKPSCTLRFEITPFYNPTADSQVDISSPSAPTPDKEGNKSNTKRTIIIIVVVLITFVALLLGSICIFLRVRRNPRVKLENNDPDEISFVESLQYEFETIRSATDDFSDANKLGQGGFGSVYKGMLSNEQYIAVKRLSKNSEQGDREFKNEVMLLAQLQHRNLVRLLGFCLKSEERLLIYEYVPNKSLNYFIFDSINHGNLDWETRYKIIGGIARGLLYLHEDSRLRIIHRDLKAGNILLDEDMNPKIADFGMARLFTIDQTQGDTKTIVGTYGYMAPEYAMHGRFSVKSDVFSFGVLVLEIVSGKKIGSFRNGENEEDLLSYVWRNWREDTVPNIIYPMLTTSSGIETMRCIHIGLLCVQENVANRPTMASLVSMLNSHSVTLSVPTRPAFCMQISSGSDILGSVQTESSDKSESSVYVTKNEPSNITEPYPR